MRKFSILLSLIVSSALAGEVAYSSVVKSVYLSKDDSKVSGRLLPTNEIEILEKADGKVKFKIKGYQNPDNPNIIYHSDGVRILALAFAKTAKPDIKVEKMGENGAWNEASVVAYTDDGDFASDNLPLFEMAAVSYNENCSICHALHDINQYSANQWPATFRSMVSRTPIEKKNEWTIIQYLQKTTTNR